MANQTNLTNEQLTKLFDNPFDLVNHAITLAHQVIESGHEFGDGADYNSATQILKRVLKDRQTEIQSKELQVLEKTTKLPNDKDLPDPMLQVI